MKKISLIFSIIILVPLTIVLLWLLASYKGIEIRTYISPNTDPLLSCPNKQVLFTEFPTDIKKVSQIEPPGFLNPTAGHVFPARHAVFNFLNQSSEHNIYAPTKVVLTKITHTEYIRDDQVTNKEYTLYFKPCREVEAGYHHLGTLSSKIDSQLNGSFELTEENLEANYRQIKYTAKTEIKLEAGELVGKSGGSHQTKSFGFSLSDTRTNPIKLANPERWNDLRQHTVCPFNYYSQSFQDKIQQPLPCNNITSDIPGTAQGTWFIEKAGNTQSQEKHLALVYDNTEKNQPVFSVGKSLKKSGLIPGLYYFKEAKQGGTTNQKFSQVKTGPVYCYEGLKNKWGDEVKKVIMLRLASNSTLHVEIRPDLSCVSIDNALSDRMTVFER